MRGTLVALLLAAAPAVGSAQAVATTQGATGEGRRIEVRGEAVEFLLIAHAADAHLAPADAPTPADSPLATFRLLQKHLVAGDIEEAALLSNEPKRRYEVLRDYRNAVGEEAFRKVYAEYFDPANRLVAEARIGEHSLLVWRIESGKRLAGQYYARVEGRWLTDDVPTETRRKLRAVLEHLRREAAEPARG